MTSAIIMALIGGFFCTLFINAHFIKQFFKGLRLCFAKTPPDDKKNTTKFDFKFWNKSDAITFLVVQAIIFAIGFGILFAWYYLAAADRTISQFIISTGWLIGLIHLVNFLIILMIDDSSRMFRDYEVPKGFCSSSLILSIGLIVLSIGCGIAGSLYNFNNQQETNTFIQEEKVPVISVDTLETLKKEVIIDGYTTGNALYRNGKIIIPISRKGNVSYAGYVVIENNEPHIVRKTLRYTPEHDSSNNPCMVARNNMPTKIFFGNWSFQLKPIGNDEYEIYYVCAYGHYRWLRAGRVVEGLAFVNAETGEFSTCTINDVPGWITGISQ